MSERFYVLDEATFKEVVKQLDSSIRQTSVDLGQKLVDEITVVEETSNIYWKENLPSSYPGESVTRYNKAHVRCWVEV